MEEGVFVESAFNMRCHRVKNTLLHIAFSATFSFRFEFNFVFFVVASNDGPPTDSPDNNEETEDEEKEINMREK